MSIASIGQSYHIQKLLLASFKYNIDKSSNRCASLNFYPQHWLLLIEGGGGGREREPSLNFSGRQHSLPIIYFV